MAKSVIQASVLSLGGSTVAVAPNATVDVFDAASGARRSLWEDREGNTGESNPFNADSNGFFRVYADPGRIRVVITTSDGTQTYRDIYLSGDPGTSETLFQSSVTDTTAGRAMIVGAFGIGSTDTPATLVDVDATDTPVGLWRVRSADTLNVASLPSGVGQNGVMIVERYNPLFMKQTYTAVAAGSADREHTYHRVYSDTDGWDTWRKSLVRSDVQSSATDTTAGALLANGAWGMVGATGLEQAPNNDLNDITRASVYISTTGTANTPSGLQFGVVRTWARSGGGLTQSFYNASGTGDGEIATRFYDTSGSSWSAWRFDAVLNRAQTFTEDQTFNKAVTKQTGWRVGPIEILAHRGFLWMAPENTIAAASNAYLAGADGIEFDVQFSSDNIPVVIHDPTVDRTTDGTGNVADKTLAELKALDAGSTFFGGKFADTEIPTLEEMLDYCRGKFSRIHLETKGDMSEAQLDTILGLVEDRRMEDVVIFISSTYADMDYVRTQNKRVGIAYIDATSGDLADLEANGGRLYCSFNPPTSALVENARARGIEPYGKVIAKEEEARDLIDLGITIIQSDNGLMCTPNHNGVTHKITRDWTGLTQVNVGGSGAISVDSDDVLTITSTSSGATYLSCLLPCGPGDVIEVEFFARRVTDTGGLAGIYGFDSDGQLFRDELNVTDNDWRRYKTTFHVENSVTPAQPCELRFGMGTAGAGQIKIHSPHVRVSSATYGGTPGLFAGMIQITGGSAAISSNRPSYGIVSVAIESTSYLRVNTDFPFDTAVHPMATATAGGAGTARQVLFHSVTGSGDGCLFRVFDMSGSAVTLASESNLFINVSG